MIHTYRALFWKGSRKQSEPHLQGGPTAQSPQGNREFSEKASKQNCDKTTLKSRQIVVGRKQLVESLLSGSSVKHSGRKSMFLLYYLIEAIYYSLLKSEVVLFWQM